VDTIEIVGGNRLAGSVPISGAKNAALPIMTAALLADGEHVFRNVPNLRDVHTMTRLLGRLGVEATYENGRVHVTSTGSIEPTAPYELVKQMRASVLVLGPLVARCGHAVVSLPGGCAIGARPIDQHLRGLEAMGADVELHHGYVEVTVPGGRLKGSDVALDFPTHTGTENLMCAAVLAKGRTTLSNCAREPEVEELARVLNKMGARIEGAGTSVISIEGVDSLHPVDHAIIPDRIEAGTFMVASAATAGDLLLEGIGFDPLEAVIAKLREAGSVVEREGDGIRVVGSEIIRPTDIITQPHPGFPTDMQAQLMMLMCLARGTSRITETVFENRFMHVQELVRLGADITPMSQVAVVRGKRGGLSGAQVMATDLRASASLVLAGLAAEGETLVDRIYHVDRGYERIEEKLRQLGATIRRVPR